MQILNQSGVGHQPTHHVNKLLLKQGKKQNSFKVEISRRIETRSQSQAEKQTNKEQTIKRSLNQINQESISVIFRFVYNIILKMVESLFFRGNPVRESLLCTSALQICEKGNIQEHSYSALVTYKEIHKMIQQIQTTSTKTASKQKSAEGLTPAHTADRKPVRESLLCTSDL